jgi:hypothetical protein
VVEHVAVCQQKKAGQQVAVQSQEAVQVVGHQGVTDMPYAARPADAGAGHLVDYFLLIPT